MLDFNTREKMHILGFLSVFKTFRQQNCLNSQDIGIMHTENYAYGA